SGRKTSCPAALLAVMIPVTSPRRRTNQRVPTIAASGTDTAPVALPITSPHSTSSCHGAVTWVLARDGSERAEDHPPQPELLVQRRGERRRQAEHQQAQR